MNPRTMTLAYRIWGDCRLHGWDRTISEIAESLDEPEARVRRVAQAKGWLNHFRSSTPAEKPQFDLEPVDVPGRWAQPMRAGAE